MVKGIDGSCSDSVFISVNVNALPNVQISSSSSLVCVGESAILLSSGANSYTWDTGANTSSIVISPLSNTNYTLVGVDINGCSNQAVYTQSVSECLGVHSTTPAWANILNLFPNPNAGEFTVVTSKTLEVKILNPLGQLIIETRLTEGSNKITLPDQAKGVYFIEFIDGQMQHSMKIIKQ